MEKPTTVVRCYSEMYANSKSKFIIPAIQHYLPLICDFKVFDVTVTYMMTIKETQGAIARCRCLSRYAYNNINIYFNCLLRLSDLLRSKLSRNYYQSLQNAQSQRLNWQIGEQSMTMEIHVNMLFV